MNRYLKLAVTVVLVASAGAAFAYIKFIDPPVITATVATPAGEKSLKLELATTNKTREHGLMNREKLAPVDGMLFRFSTPNDYAFWMKNTLIPLDMLFVDATHRIVFIAANTTPQSLEPIRAGKPVTTIIEIDGGRAAREAITVGEKVEYEIPATVPIE